MILPLLFELKLSADFFEVLARLYWRPKHLDYLPWHGSSSVEYYSWRLVFHSLRTFTPLPLSSTQNLLTFTVVCEYYVYTLWYRHSCGQAFDIVTVSQDFRTKSKKQHEVVCVCSIAYLGKPGLLHRQRLARYIRLYSTREDMEQTDHGRSLR